MRFRLPPRNSLVRSLFMLIAAWGVLSTTAVAVFILSNDPDPDHRAILKMGIGLILIWCVLGGLVMYRFRDSFVAWATRIPLGWRTRFVLLCIIFAMLEEAVTTSLTNRHHCLAVSPMPPGSPPPRTTWKSSSNTA